MIRRKADHIAPLRSRSGSPTSAAASARPRAASPGKAAPRGRCGWFSRYGKRGPSSSEESTWAARRFRMGLLLVAKAALVILFLAYKNFPSTSTDPALRSSSSNLHSSSSSSSQPLVVNGVPVNEATRRMYAQESKWVDGEKALKKQLRKLADLQAQGKELGVPALTRYLGEDFPAWAGTGVDRAEWESRRDKKYAEMREAEGEWNRKIRELIDQNKQRG